MEKNCWTIQRSEPDNLESKTPTPMHDEDLPKNQEKFKFQTLFFQELQCHSLDPSPSCFAGCGSEAGPSSVGSNFPDQPPRLVIGPLHRARFLMKLEGWREGRSGEAC